MAKESTLYEQVKGDVLSGYLLLKEQGGNVPASWIARYKGSRKILEKEIAKILKKNDLRGLGALRDWNNKFMKEQFYYGIRALMELERNGKTKY